METKNMNTDTYTHKYLVNVFIFIHPTPPHERDVTQSQILSGV